MRKYDEFMESLQYLFLNAANRKNGANSECIATIKPYMHPIKISFSAQGLEKKKITDT